MGRRSFSREFKLEAVRLVRERGVAVAQAARDLDLHENMLRKWVKDFAADPAQAFPGQGQMKPEQAEIERLRREVAKLKAERDILKNHPGASLLLWEQKRVGGMLPTEGSGRRLIGGERPRQKTWPMGSCALESGDAFGRSRLGK
jgi:transposase